MKIIKKLIEEITLPDIDLEKNYGRVRKIQDRIRKPRNLKSYKMWDYKILNYHHEIPVREFKPKKPSKQVIIYFHGGGWVIGNIDTYSKVAQNIANVTNSIVYSIDYRLAPENKFPKGFSDCFQATKFIYKQAKILRINADDITLMGDSAGANMAASVALKCRDTLGFVPKRQILIYPAVDALRNVEKYPSVEAYKNVFGLTLKNMEDYMNLYIAKKADIKSPFVSPIRTKNLKNMPDTLIITAELDLLRDEGEAYGKKLRDAGNKVLMHRVLEVGHGFFNGPVNSRSVKETLDLVQSFLKGDE